MADIVIIGTGHQLQAGHAAHSAEQHSEFRVFVQTTCQKYGIRIVAEEMSEDLLRDYGVTETNCAKVARSMTIDHCLVDLTASERAHLGLDRFGLHQTAQAAGLSEAQAAALDAAVGDLRECIWVTRVVKLNKWPALFICGATHGPSVKRLFDSIGKQAILEAVDYEPYTRT